MPGSRIRRQAALSLTVVIGGECGSAIAERVLWYGTAPTDGIYTGWRSAIVGEWSTRLPAVWGTRSVPMLPRSASHSSFSASVSSPDLGWLTTHAALSGAALSSVPAGLLPSTLG